MNRLGRSGACLLVKPLQSQLSTDVQTSQNLNKVNYTWNQNTHTVDQRHAFEAPKFKTVVACSGSGNHYCNLPQMLNYPLLHLTIMPKTLPNNLKYMVVYLLEVQISQNLNKVW
jgi:hypothetical protein